jgi:lipopolysaccharide/colanic/teichoic acid biosynthesis glycosyltransferase
MDIADVVIAMALLAPRLAFLAIVIKGGLARSVFFRRSRIGRHGQQFWMIKFRMCSVVAACDSRRAGRRSSS